MDDEKMPFTEIGKLEGRVVVLEEKFLMFMAEIRDDIGEIKRSSNQVSQITNEQKHLIKSVERAFKRIEALEREVHELDATANQLKGAQRLAWTMYTILGGGLVMTVIEILSSAPV